MDADAFPDPTTFNPHRPKEAYILFGAGQHECIGKPISNTYVVAMLKATAGLQRIQMADGALRTVQHGLQDMYLNDDGSDLERHPSTAKLTLSYYTRDPTKALAPVYAVAPAFLPARPVTKDGKPNAGAAVVPKVNPCLFRPQDIATEMWHIDHDDDYDVEEVEGSSSSEGGLFNGSSTVITTDDGHSHTISSHSHSSSSTTQKFSSKFYQHESSAESTEEGLLSQIGEIEKWGHTHLEGHTY